MEYVPISSLSQDPSNARKHSKKNLDAIKGSLAKFDLQKPIVISSDNIVLAGNGTLAAAKELGWKDIGIIRSKLTGTEAIAYAIADNRTGELAEWDDDILGKALGGLKAENFDLKEIGFDDEDLLRWLKEPEVVPGCGEDEVPDVSESRSKMGDIWLLSNHRLLCGDSTNILDVEKLMDGEKADMVFTDPPYGIKEKCDRSNTGSKRRNLVEAGNFKSFKDDSIQFAIDAFNLCDSLKIPRQVWWGANYYCHALPLSNNWFVWDKRVEDKQTDDNSDCELAWVKSKWSSIRIFRHLWKGLIKDSERGEARIHPTQKPIALAEWTFDYFKDVKSVLDLFLGSGSTLIACEKTKRKCYGMEIDPHYCDIIIARWEKFTGKTAILKSGLQQDG